jgi:hypothetical protein
MSGPDWGRTWRFCILGLLLGPSALAEPFHGFVYEAFTGRKNPIFTLKRTEDKEPDGTQVVEGFYYPVGGPAFGPRGGDQPALHDLVRVKNHKLQKFIQEQNQIGAWGTLEPRGNQIHFEWVDQHHEMQVNNEDNPPNLIVGATLIDFLRDHWGDILQGQGVDARFAVLDRQETIGFQFKMVARERKDGKELIHVRMSPTSIFVQMVFKPLELVLERKKVRLLSLRGVVGLKRRVGNAWKDIEVEMVYEYDDVPVPTPEPRR